MKKLLLTWLLLSGTAQAQDANLPPSLLSVPGLGTFIGDALKNAKVVMLMDTQSFVFRKGVAVPLRTLRDSQGNGYVEVALGADTQSFQEVRPLAMVTSDLTRIADRLLFKSAWAQAHITKDLNLPDFWFGPYLRLPVPEDKFQFKNIRDFIGISFSMKV